MRLTTARTDGSGGTFIDAPWRYISAPSRRGSARNAWSRAAHQGCGAGHNRLHTVEVSRGVLECLWKVPNVARQSLLRSRVAGTTRRRGMHKHNRLQEVATERSAHCTRTRSVDLLFRSMIYTASLI
jgi:hypothetical protein